MKRLLIPVVWLGLTLAHSTSAQDWRLREWTDPMSDFENVAFSLDADSPVYFNHGSRTPSLTIGCFDDRTAIYVDWRGFITTGGIYSATQVRYRIDEQTAVDASWGVSTDYEATGLWRGRGTSLLRQMHQVDMQRFLVSTIPHGDNSVLATFSTSGNRDVLQTVSERCHWSVPTSNAGASAQPEQATGNLLDTIAESEPTTPSTPTRLPANEEQAIAQALRNCWNVDRGAPFIETLRVTIRARMQSTGFVQDAEIVSLSGQATDAQVRSWAEAVRRAVLNPNCQPLPSPSRGFGNGDVYEFSFNPRDLF